MIGACMNFENRLKGSITQTLVGTLLEDVSYRVVPLGIEEVIREVSCLSGSEYSKLNLSDSLRKLPDFFIAKKDLSQSWLVEVKYRRKWDESTKAELEEKLKAQAQIWAPLYLILFVKEKARTNETPSSYLGVCKLIVKDGQLGRMSQTFSFKKEDRTDVFEPWSEFTWQSFKRFQDVFDGVSDKWQDETLIKIINIMQNISDE
jgi:hypothetical protein